MVVKQPLVLRQNNNKATYLETTLQELSEDLLQKRLKTSSASCCTIMLLLFRRRNKSKALQSVLAKLFYFSYVAANVSEEFLIWVCAKNLASGNMSWHNSLLSNTQQSQSVLRDVGSGVWWAGGGHSREERWCVEDCYPLFFQQSPTKAPAMPCLTRLQQSSRICPE